MRMWSLAAGILSHQPHEHYRGWSLMLGDLEETFL